MLAREGPSAGRLHVGTLMRRMGIKVVRRKRRTSLPDESHKVFPYLLRDVGIDRPDQVWATDITYVPMAQGSAYIVAIVDRYSRRVLS